MKCLKCLLIALVFLQPCLLATPTAMATVDSLRWTLDQEALSWPADELVPLYLALGKALQEVNEFPEALELLDRGIHLAKSEALSQLILDLELEQGICLFHLGKYEEALPLLKACIKGNKKRGTKRRAVGNHFLSKIFQINGTYEQAYKHALDGLLQREQSRDSLGMALALNQVGQILNAQENFQMALSKFEAAMAILEKSPDEKLLLETYGALAAVYEKLERKDKSMNFNRKALALSEKYEYKPGIAVGQSNNADLYIDLGLYELAAEQYASSFLLFEELNDKMGQVKTQLGIGHALLKIEHFERALDHLDEAGCLAAEMGANKPLSLVYKYLAQANMGLGNAEHGYQYLYKYTALKDSMLNELSWIEMGAEQDKYEVASRENEIALLKAEKNLLEKEKKIKGLYWGLLSIFVIFFSGLLFILFSKWKMQARLLKLLELRGEKIKVQNDKLAQSNLDLQHFASVASHDLREPLRMINSYTKLLNRRYSKTFDANAQEFMGFIMDAATRMDRMLTDLLDYSRAEKKGERDQWVGAVDLVETALANLTYKINSKGAKVDYLKSHLPQLYVNRTAMIQLFQNLISNAVKFSDVEAPEVVIDCVKRGPFYCFAIKDNGIGIKKEKQTEIFEMFTRLHSQQEFEGTGIGLATCKKIVSRQGGEIWVESNEGQGSTFYFTIPQDVSSN